MGIEIKRKQEINISFVCDMCKKKLEGRDPEHDDFIPDKIVVVDLDNWVIGVNADCAVDGCSDTSYVFCPDCWEKFPQWVKKHMLTLLNYREQQGGLSLKTLQNASKDKVYVICSGQEDSQWFGEFDTIEEAKKELGSLLEEAGDMGYNYEDIYMVINGIDYSVDYGVGVTVVGYGDDFELEEQRKDFVESTIHKLINDNEKISQLSTLISAMMKMTKEELEEFQRFQDMVKENVFTERQPEIIKLVLDAINIDGGHHKQWYLEKIAEKLGVKIKHKTGVPP